MKTSAIPFLLVFLLLGACAGREEPRTGPMTGSRKVLDVLKAKKPAASWNEKSLIEGDFNLDGTSDSALSGVQGERFVVGIVSGKTGSELAWTLDFPWDGDEDALCSKSAKISPEPLEENEGPKAEHPAKGLGINLHDDRCDAFHIYWNPKSKDFEYWRL